MNPWKGMIAYVFKGDKTAQILPQIIKKVSRMLNIGYF